VVENAKLVPSGFSDGTAHALPPGASSAEVFATAMEASDGSQDTVLALLAPQACNALKPTDQLLEGLSGLVAIGRRAQEAEQLCVRLQGEVQVLMKEKAESEQGAQQRDAEGSNLHEKNRLLQMEVQVATKHEAEAMCTWLPGEMQAFLMTKAALQESNVLSAKEIWKQNGRLKEELRVSKQEVESRCTVLRKEVQLLKADKADLESDLREQEGFRVTTLEAESMCEVLKERMRVLKVDKADLESDLCDVKRQLTGSQESNAVLTRARASLHGTSQEEDEAVELGEHFEATMTVEDSLREILRANNEPKNRLRHWWTSQKDKDILTRIKSVLAEMEENEKVNCHLLLQEFGGLSLQTTHLEHPVVQMLSLLRLPI
jgi:hypothetical protein